MLRLLSVLLTALVFPTWFALMSMGECDNRFLRVMWLVVAVIFLPLFLVAFPFHYLVCEITTKDER
jgi:predicted Na+-dependent transporter